MLSPRELEFGTINCKNINLKSVGEGRKTFQWGQGKSRKLKTFLRKYLLNICWISLSQKLILQRGVLMEFLKNAWKKHSVGGHVESETNHLCRLITVKKFQMDFDSC